MTEKREIRDGYQSASLVTGEIRDTQEALKRHSRDTLKRLDTHTYEPLRHSAGLFASAASLSAHLLLSHFLRASLGLTVACSG